jgi:hypothetical protein
MFVFLLRNDLQRFNRAKIHNLGLEIPEDLTRSSNKEGRKNPGEIFVIACDRRIGEPNLSVSKKYDTFTKFAQAVPATSEELVVFAHRDTIPADFYRYVTQDDKKIRLFVHTVINPESIERDEVKATYGEMMIEGVGLCEAIINSGVAKPKDKPIDILVDKSVGYTISGGEEFKIDFITKMRYGLEKAIHYVKDLDATWERLFQLQNSELIKAALRAVVLLQVLRDCVDNAQLAELDKLIKLIPDPTVEGAYSDLVDEVNTIRADGDASLFPVKADKCLEHLRGYINRLNPSI